MKSVGLEIVQNAVKSSGGGSILQMKVKTVVERSAKKWVKMQSLFC